MRAKWDFKMVGIIILVIIFAVFIGFLIPALNHFNKEETKETQALEDIMNKALVQCYALEGSYPPDLDYLANNYGIILNKDKYYYYYEIYAANVHPNLEIIVK